MAADKALKKSKTREYAEAIIIAVLLALVIRAFIVQAFKIPSGSMIPTLLIGDHILVNKFVYGTTIPLTDSRFLIFNAPKRGDVIVFSFPGNKEKEECTSAGNNISFRLSNFLNSGNPGALFHDDCRDFIKRVVGVGGDRIEIKDKKVYVNKVLLDEPYTVHSDPGLDSNSPRDNLSDFTVPRNKVFVMGDNRDQSYDSRFWGFVSMEEIKGKAFIMYWSWNTEGEWFSKVRWDRLGSLIH
ncbi:MAG: signal peptidase I [Nitrospira sp.]|nr:signal peptidase I [bacterium]MBL7049684.1 signal peptidase I [Nitrospira sp.]